jgi:hypothetical protein
MPIKRKSVNKKTLKTRGRNTASSTTKTALANKRKWSNTRAGKKTTTRSGKLSSLTRTGKRRPVKGKLVNRAFRRTVR